MKIIKKPNCKTGDKKTNKNKSNRMYFCKDVGGHFNNDSDK
jgi:hypothetical protein